MIWLFQFYPNFKKENALGNQRLPIPLPLSTNLARLEARRLFIVYPCRKGTKHFRKSMPSPGFKPRPYGTSVSVTIHYTGWMAKI
ncbi:hypothetical protein TNCV_1118441 [Trichonephila clavipes]|uniref:Uncharacterized protein n=1 Tax=Trichonephila clavipes TaxID=2585209 RepID=A0A8X6T080_TRICX|nr:hypothetical protein TNCV_1118441 [Trichonephila clavipes]